MLEAAKRLLTPSRRSNVPPFIVMDVMAAAARARGARAPASSIWRWASRRRPAPRTAHRGGAGRAGEGPHRLYRDARHPLACAPASPAITRETYDLALDPGRVVVTTGSSGGFILAFLALFEPGDRVALANPGYPPYRHILSRARLRAGADRDRGRDALGAVGQGADRRAPAQSRSPAWWSQARPIRPAP